MKRATAEKGFAAIAAIFLIVVLAALGSYMLTFSNTQQLSSAQDVLGSRVYWAARSGLEAGLAQADLPTPNCPASTALTIEGFAVTVTCTAATYTEGSASPVIYRISATAVAGGAVGTVGRIERSVTATMEK